MIGLKILDLKDFTGKLFLENTFDNFLVTEAKFVTSYSVFLDGRLTIPVEENGLREFAFWRTLRPLAFQIMKGKQLPKSFHIVLKLTEENTQNTLRAMGLPSDQQENVGLFLNIYYDHEELHCTTGCVRSGFSLDRSMELGWDGYVKKFLKAKQISTEDV